MALHKQRKVERQGIVEGGGGGDGLKEGGRVGRDRKLKGERTSLCDHTSDGAWTITPHTTTKE